MSTIQIMIACHKPSMLPDNPLYLPVQVGAALKSDILQVPHHGAAPGGSVEAYDLIDPDVLLWPAGDQLYADLLAEMNPGPCGHLVSMVSPENIHIAGVLGRVTPIYFA